MIEDPIGERFHYAEKRRVLEGGMSKNVQQRSWLLWGGHGPGTRSVFHHGVGERAAKDEGEGWGKVLNHRPCEPSCASNGHIKIQSGLGNQFGPCGKVRAEPGKFWTLLAHSFWQHEGDVSLGGGKHAKEFLVELKLPLFRSHRISPSCS